MPSLLGIDSGLTVTKAVLFDIDGTTLAVARRRVAQSFPRARHVERDMDEFWNATADAIAEAIAKSGRPASDILAIATTAHGDGIYMLDKDRRPLGAGILSLDSRAVGVAECWVDGPVAEQAIAITGQLPHASAPSAILAWVKENEPERFGRIAHVIACKDWLRFCLTGDVGTDRTEASTSFTDVNTQEYSKEALALFGLDALWDALPPMSRSDEIVGSVSGECAERTGLVAGTPVVGGLHDVTASALGVGGLGIGTVAVVAGTYSINETLSSEPRVNKAGSAAMALRRANGTICRSRPHRRPITTGFSTSSARQNGARQRKQDVPSTTCCARKSMRHWQSLRRQCSIPTSSVRPMERWRAVRFSVCVAGRIGVICCAQSGKALPSIIASMSIT